MEISVTKPTEEFEKWFTEKFGSPVNLHQESVMSVAYHSWMAARQAVMGPSDERKKLITAVREMAEKCWLENSEQISTETGAIGAVRRIQREHASLVNKLAAVGKPPLKPGAAELIEEIAAYVESDSECLMPIVVEETRHQYGVRLLKVMAEEIRTKFALAPVPADLKPAPEGA
jgi:hypothetical protein